MGDYALTTSKLCKYYGQNQILENVTMSVPSKSIYGLVGENGAGKTTLFRILAGLSKPAHFQSCNQCPYRNYRRLAEELAL